MVLVAQPHIIPYQELSGNYNSHGRLSRRSHDYTIPRTVRELQRIRSALIDLYDYTIPRTVRELQPKTFCNVGLRNYTIPRTVRELQQLQARCRGQPLIIPYQELSGDYNRNRIFHCCEPIIPYQDPPPGKHRTPTGIFRPGVFIF